jgi:hypothetical protein
MSVLCRRSFVSPFTPRFFLCVIFASLGTTLVAAPPVVEFDVAQTASFRSVDSSSCAKHRPHANIVEVVFEISTRLQAGKEEDLKYITYEITSPDHQLSVAGFLPTTTMISESADGVINFEEHRSPAQLNIEYAGSSAKITAPLRTPTDTKVSIKKLAPKSLVMSSGTIDRAHGVYFTLHPSEQDSLQRAHQFVCYFDAPANFRSDYVQISCVAMARDQTFTHSTSGTRPVGLAKFNVGIYRDGDFEARKAVDHCAQVQLQLNDAVAAYQTAFAQKVEKSDSKRSSNDIFKSVLHVVRKEPIPTKRSEHNAKLESGSNDAHQTQVVRAQENLVAAQRALELARRTVREMNSIEPTLVSNAPAAIPRAVK